MTPHGFSSACGHVGSTLHRAVRSNSKPLAVPASAVLLLAFAQIAWAQVPAANTLAFESNRSGRFQVWTQALDSNGMPVGNPVQVTTAGGGNQESRAPDWSVIAALPNGEIAYQFGAPGVRGIHLINPDGTGDTRVSSAPGDKIDPTWSQDAMFIAYAKLPQGTSDYDIWIHKVSDPDDTNDYDLLPRPSNLDLRPAWSPDGKSIAFVTVVAGHAQIAIVGVTFDAVVGTIVTTTSVQLLTATSFTNFDPTWSPDSRSIAFSSTRSGGTDIYRMSATGGESDTAHFVRLTTDPAGDTTPAWSPDGSTIAFASDRTGNRETYLMRADTGETGGLTNITNNPADDRNPSWKPMPPCGRPMFRGSYPNAQNPKSIDSSGWSMTAAVTDRDGLEVRDVMLADRYMAARMNLPYFKLETTNFPLGRCELKPNSADSSCQSRLVDFSVSPPGTPTLRIEAVYEVDNIPQGSDSCLILTQRYDFDEAARGCEPSETLPCARFRPTVDYHFFGPQGDAVNSINVAQRLHFVVDEIGANSSGVFKDCDLPLCNGTIFFDKINPLDAEIYANAIFSGGVGTWDDFHQTYNGSVVEPGLTFDPLPHCKPGCPECVHIHWRWGGASNVCSPGFTDGEPIVPPGSNQDVYFAVVRWHRGEEHPDDCRTLVSGESPIGTGIVFWYSATGYQNNDTFFTHGGFFSPGNTPVGTSVSVQPEDTSTGTTPITLTFDSVHQTGMTTLTTGSSGPPPPAGFRLGDPPTYYDLTTSAVFSGPISVCIDYSQIIFTNPANLKLFHFEDGAWVDRTVSLDIGTQIICATVSALSPFAIVEVSDTTPPVITISAMPATLWPPNGEMVAVTVSGTITDAGSGVNVSAAAYAVTDEYGSVQPSGHITLGESGSYSFTIQLQASRNGDDRDGRQYTITGSAQDNAGNKGSAASGVTVPHDQRK